MGNACSEKNTDTKDITDETWSKQLGKYLEIEDTDVEADLIYHFDGKNVTGDCT